MKSEIARNIFAVLSPMESSRVTGAVTASLTSALNFVSQQRVTIDNSINRLNTASGVAKSESIQLTAVQTNLMQADIPAVSTQLSLTQSQQSALISVISALGSGSLFDKL
jgi:flagellar hook-associated protein 3 FlgL